MPQDCVPVSDKPKFWVPLPAVLNSLFIFLCLVGIALVILAIVILFVDVKRSQAWQKTTIQVVGIGALGVFALGLGIYLPIHHHADLDETDSAEGLTGVATASGAIITAIIAATTLYTVILLRKSVNEQIEATNQEKIAVQKQTEQLRATAIQNIGHEMMDINRWMADHLDYRKALRLPMHVKSEEGAAAAEIYADFIDQVVSQEEFLPEDHVEAWRSWFAYIIDDWPQLRKFMEESPNDWYLDNMNSLLSEKAQDQGCADSPPTAQQNAEEDVSLWDEAARQKRKENKEGQQVWNKLVPLFNEFAAVVKAKRVKPSDRHGFHKKAWLVGVGPYKCEVVKDGRWSFFRACSDDGVRTRHSIGDSSKGLVDSQWLSNTDLEQWRKAFVAYMVRHTA